MKVIKIIAGTYGHKEGGNVIGKTEKDAPFSVPNETAARLVRLEVAEYAELDPSDETMENSGLPEYNEGMKLALLKIIAQQYGADASAAKSKKEAVAIIDAAKAAREAKGSDENNENDGAGENEQPPTVQPAAPVQ